MVVVKEETQRSVQQNRVQKWTPTNMAPLMFDRYKRNSMEKGQTFQPELLENPVSCMSSSARINLK